MTIKDGYNSKPTRINISARTDTDERKAELWVEQEGTEHWLLGATLSKVGDVEHYPDFTVVQDEKGNRLVRGEEITKISGQETLAYITLDELLQLRDECNKAIQELIA